MSLLEVNDIHTFYGNIEALKGISLKVEQGEIVTLIGGNGAGKTTTLNTISGITPARTGTVTLNGEDITRMASHRRVRCGIVRTFQINQSFHTLTPLQSLALLNDRVFLDAARGLAERSKREAGDDFASRLDFAFCAVTARQPEEAERTALAGLFERRRHAFEADRPQAVALMGGDDSSASAAIVADRAAWVLISNTILNLNEAITRE